MSTFNSTGGGSINQTFRSAVERFPDEVFLDFSGDVFTYAAMATRVESFARGLHALGVQSGDRVVTMLNTGPDAVMSWLAANHLGAILVPINTAYKGEFLRHQLSDAGARTAIIDAEYLPYLAMIRAELPVLEHVLYSGARLAAEDGVSHIDEHRFDAGEAPYVEVTPSNIAMLLYTSGTTGPSKGCIVSHNYICDLSRRFAGMGKATPEETVWTPLPLYHIYAITIVVSAMQMGGRASFARRFSVSGFWSEILRSKAKVVNLLGSMASMIANAPDTADSKACYGQIRALLCTPTPPSLKQAWRERFGVGSAGLIAYGQTEAGAMVTCACDEAVPDNCAGRLIDTFDVRILDDNDEELPRNHVGEVVVRPLKPNVMFSGYWNLPSSSFALAANYWHHTGDLGKIDEEGYFFFVDRKKDYLRRRGENISSFEVEQTLAKHPAISEVAIHSVPSAVTEDDIKATIVLHAGATLSAPDLYAWAADRIPRFALPRYIEFRNELPKNAVGRLLKYQLRDDGVTESTWDQEIAVTTKTIKTVRI